MRCTNMHRTASIGPTGVYCCLRSILGRKVQKRFFDKISSANPRNSPTYQHVIYFDNFTPYIPPEIKHKTQPQKNVSKLIRLARQGKMMLTLARICKDNAFSVNATFDVANGLLNYRFRPTFLLKSQPSSLRVWRIT